MSNFRILFPVLMMFSCKFSAQTTGNRTVGITLPVVTLMDIEPPGNISFSFSAPTEAGNPVIAPLSNTSKWLNYTSAVAAAGLPRRITASINQIIPGIDIKIQAAAASGSTGGILGTPSSQITLNTTAQTIISGIRGAYTGNGANNGHRLTITLSANTYANLSARTNTPVVITYTITE